MGALFLRKMGRLDGDAEILDVGAGSEEIMYWLAGRAKRVVAIDIYGRGEFGDWEAVASVFEDPKAHAPYPYPEDRLEVRDMDARDLDFPDESFDAVVSFSSIEHFGSLADIRRSAAEIGRVLRPGGHAFIVTETFARHDPLDRAPVHFAVRLASLGRRCAQATPIRRPFDVFTVRELKKHIVDASGLQLMQPLQVEFSDETWTNIQRIQPDGTVIPSSGEEYPHVLVQGNRSIFTSICLPLVKSA